MTWALREEQGKSFWQPELHAGSIFSRNNDDSIGNPGGLPYVDGLLNT